MPNYDQKLRTTRHLRKIYNINLSKTKISQGTEKKNQNTGQVWEISQNIKQNDQKKNIREKKEIQEVQYL